MSIAAKTVKEAPKWMLNILRKEGGGYIPSRAALWKQPISWGQMDAMRHVNNVQYLRFFETARINSYLDLEREFIGTQNFMSGTGVGPILRSVNLQWRYPINFPDEVSVIYKIDNYGEDRFTAKAVLISHNAEKVAARLEEVIVTVDYDNGTRKAPIPDAWRKVFDALLKEQGKWMGDAI